MNKTLHQLREIVMAALILTAAAIAALALGWIIGWPSEYGTRIIVLFSFWLGSAATTLLVVNRYRRHLRWKHVGVAAALLAPVVTYLCWDEPPPATPLDLEALAPAPPRAAESHALILGAGLGPDEQEPRRWAPAALGYISRQLQSAEWRVFLTANRDAIRADWEACPAARNWILQLDAFEAIGDLTTSSGAPKMRHVAFADTCFLHCAYAGLLALEGRGDDALMVLRPVLSVCRKLKSSARTQHRYLNAGACQRATQSAALFILQTTMPSAEFLRKFDAVLAPPEDLATALHRVLLCECTLTIQANATGISLLRRPDFLPFRLFYNPNATDSLTTRHYRDLLAVATEGRGEGSGAHERAAQQTLGSHAFKNVMGEWWVAMMIAFPLDRIVKDSLATEDSRRALLAEVQAKLAAAEKKESAQPPPTVR